LNKIIGSAAQKAMPGLAEPVYVTAEKNKAWDYVCPSVMKVFNMTKKQGSFGFSSCKDMADAILANIDPANDAIDEISLSPIGKGDPSKLGFFLNIKLKDDYIQARIKTLTMSETVKMLDNPTSSSQEESKNSTEKKQRVLVDFSSPNIAKDMHVGHLRSTIQGDSICRIFEFLGNEVLRVNHVGDWGTQFGMLITELDEAFPNWITECPEISDLQTFY
jgi:arginyl-tRNA synthetase